MRRFPISRKPSSFYLSIKPGSPLVYKVSWRTKKDMNEIEWNKYQSLSAGQKKLVVPILEYHKLQDGNSVLIQARAKTVNQPTAEELADAKQIMAAVGVCDHVNRNVGYYQGKLRVLDIDSPAS